MSNKKRACMRRVIDKFLELCDSSELKMFQQLTGKPDTTIRHELFINSEKMFLILQFKWFYAMTYVFAESLDSFERSIMVKM